jgi:hypothetical protein
MLSDIEEDASLNGETAQYSHELVIRDDIESAEMTPQSIATSGETSLNLAQGENWLRLVETLDRNSVLRDTQETSAGVCSPYPSIVSLADVGMIDAPTDDCYICIDVDGPYAAIKDMRAPILSSDEVAELEVCIARRKRPTPQVDSDDEYDGQDSNMKTDRQYHSLESLGRRQLRILHRGDVIATRSTGGEDTIGLILEYRRYHGSRADEEMAVEGSETAVESQNDTQDRTPSIVIQTQEIDNDEGEATYDDEEDEATQAFPKPVLTTQQDPNTQDTESDDETAMDEEHEVDIQQGVRVDAPTRAFSMPAIDSEPEDDDIMEQPTQTLRMAAEVDADIMEQSTQVLSMAAEVDADIMEQSTQVLSSHAEDSEVHDNSKEAVIATDEDLQVEREASEGSDDTGDDNSVENDLAVSSTVDSNTAEGPNEVAEAVDDIMDGPTQALNMPVVADSTEQSTDALMPAEVAADIMEQPTQTLSVHAEVVADIMEEPTQAMHMPAEVIADIMDQPTQALSKHAEAVVDIMDQSTQALSVHAEESEVVDNSKEASIANDKNVEVESRLEGEIIDDDDASAALLDEDSPRKKRGEAETDENVVAVTAEPRTRKYIEFETRLESNINEEAVEVALPMQDQRHNSADTAQVDETSSDSSSITEVDEEVWAQSKNLTSSVGGSNIHAPKKIVVGEASEAEPRTEADGTAQLESSTKQVGQGDKHEKPVDAAPDDEVMSDSSSITEVDEDISGKLANKRTSIEENASHNLQKRVDVATSEAVPAHVDDSSDASSISEPPVVSPQRGPMSVSRDVKKAQEPSDQPNAPESVASKMDTAKEIAFEGEGVASQSFITRMAKLHPLDNSITEPQSGATGSPMAQKPRRETHSSSPDAEVTSLSRSQEVKDVTAVLSEDKRNDGKDATDERLAEATTAESTRSPDSASVPDAREVDEKDAPEGETPRRTRSRKAHNTPRRQTKEDSPKISTPARGDEKKRAREDYSLRGSTRKRSRAAVGSQSSEGVPIRVIITGFDVTAHHKKVRNADPLLLPLIVFFSSHRPPTAFSDAVVYWRRTVGRYRRRCVGHTRDCRRRRNVPTPHTQTHDWYLPNKQDCPHELVDPIGEGTRSATVQ